jgi:ABC-type nitrate/sulfonate/bicarbonate transport system substrate-binding protein
LQHVVTVRPEITTPQQLEGKRVAVQALGTLPAFQVQKLAEHFGLRDVAMVVAGSEMERIAAIEAGAADAAISSIPANLVAERRGLPTLLRVGAVLDIPQAGLATTEAHLRDRPEFVARTLRAAARALPAVRERRDEVIQLIAQWIELPPEDAARAYEQVVDTYSPNGLATDAQLRAYLQLMQETANVPADATLDRLYDFALARRVAAELGLPLP